MEKFRLERTYINLKGFKMLRTTSLIMVLLVFVMLGAFMLSGCVMAKKDDLLYIRFGDQKIEGLYIESDGKILELNRQESQTEFIKYLIELGMSMRPTP